MHLGMKLVIQKSSSFCRNLEPVQQDIRVRAAAGALSIFFKELVILALLTNTNGSTDRIPNLDSKVKIYVIKLKLCN